MNAQTQQAVESFIAKGGQIKTLPKAKKSEVKWSKILKDQKIKETTNAKV